MIVNEYFDLVNKTSQREQFSQKWFHRRSSAAVVGERSALCWQQNTTILAVTLASDKIALSLKKVIEKAKERAFLIHKYVIVHSLIISHKTATLCCIN